MRQSTLEGSLAAASRLESTLESAIAQEESLAQLQDMDFVAGQSVKNAALEQKKAEQERKMKQMMEEKKARAAEKIKLKAVEVLFFLYREVFFSND